MKPPLLATLTSLILSVYPASGDEPPVYIIRTEEPNPGPPPDFIAGIEKKLKSIVIPQIEFNETPLTDAMDFLQQKSVELDKEPEVTRQGIAISIASSSLVKPVNRNKPEKIVPVTEKTINLNLKNATLGEALTETGKQAGLRYTIKSHSLVFVSDTVPEIKTVSYRYQIDLPLFRKILHTVPTGDFIEPALVKIGIKFPSGTRARFNYRDLCVRVTNSRDQIELIEDIIERVSKGRVISTDEAIRLGLLPNPAVDEGLHVNLMRWITVIILIFVFMPWALRRW